MKKPPKRPLPGARRRNVGAAGFAAATIAGLSLVSGGLSAQGTGTTQPATTSSATAASGPHATKGQVVAQSLGDAPAVFPADGSCSVDGDRGDALLNDQKNRFRVPAAADINPGVKTPDDGFALPVPPGANGQQRSVWPHGDAGQIAAIEGTAATIEGFIVDVIAEKNGAGESSNCHSVADGRYDFHIFVADDKTKGKDEAMVVEMTPRWQSINKSWGANILAAKKEKPRVRVTGWLMFDEEHINMVGTARGTVWELHPVTKIEKQAANGSFAPL